MANLPSNFYTNPLIKIGNDIILKNPQGTKTKSVFLTITNTTFMSWAFSSTRFQKWTTFPCHPSQYILIPYVPAHIAMLKMPNGKTKLRDDKQTSSCFFRTFLNFPLCCPDTIIVAIISGSSQVHSGMYTVTMAEKTTKSKASSW
jgi:hypothetical protein